MGAFFLLFFLFVVVAEENRERERSDNEEGMVLMSSCAKISLDTLMSVGEIVAFQQQEKALGG